MGIEAICRFTALFGNFKWEILRNDVDESPFFTSDFPAAIERTDDPRVLNRIVPLTPGLALRIKPDVAIDKDRVDFSFAKFTSFSRKPGRDEIVRLNQTIVRCAEDSVFYRDDHSWVRSFVSKNRWFHVEPRSDRLPTGSGTLLVSTQRVVARPPSSCPNEEEPATDEPQTPA